MARFTGWQMAFLVVLLVAIPTGTYHFVNGRYANAVMAFGALLVGLLLLAIDRRARATDAG